MGDSGILWPTVIMAGASVVNVLVLLGYAISTRGIRRETQRSAENTHKLAQRSWDALKLQIVLTLVSGRERLTWSQDPGRFLVPDPTEPITYLTAPLLAALPEESQRAEVRALMKLVFGVEPK